MYFSSRQFNVVPRQEKGGFNIYLAEKTFPFIFGNEMQLSKKHTKQVKKHSSKAEG